MAKERKIVFVFIMYRKRGRHLYHTHAQICVCVREREREIFQVKPSLFSRSVAITGTVEEKE